MKVLVIGAAGKTGSEIVRRAVAAGHEVSAFVRNAKDIEGGDVRAANIRVVEGDSTLQQDIDAAVAGQEAVLDAVGGGHKAFLDTDLESSTAAHVIEAMRRHGVRRLIAISMLGEGDSGTNASFFYEHILLPTYLRGADKDKAAMEREVQASDLDWIILRPAVLNDKPASGNIQTFTPGDGRTAHGIARSDVAAFMIQQLTSDEYLGQTVTIATD